MLNATFVPKIQWTDELIEKGRTLVAEGHSYEKAAREIGITKGALIGKLSRLGIKPDRGPAVIRVADPRRGRTLKVNVMTKKAPARPWVDRVPANEPAPLKIPMMALRPFHCRKVVDGETGDDCVALYCGHPILHDETAYCAYHHNRFRTPPRR